MEDRGTAWLTFLVLSIGALVVYYLLPTVPQDLLYDLFGLSAVSVIGFGLKRHRFPPGEARAWLLLALGQLSFFIADVIWDFYTYVLDVESPYPSVADVFYLAAYPPLVFGLLRLVRQRAPGRDVAGLIDATIIATGLGLLAWVYVMQPLAGDPGVSPMERTVSLSYPVADVLLLVVVVLLALSGGLTTGSDRLLALSVVAMLAADIVYAATLLTDSYHDGSAIDAGWLLSYSLLAAASLHPSARATAKRSEIAPPNLTAWRLTFLCGAALLGLVVLGLEDLRGRPVGIGAVVIASVGLFLLVTGRLVGVNRALVGAHAQLDGALARERVLREAGTKLLVATERDAIREAALDAAQDLAVTEGGRVAVVTGPAEVARGATPKADSRVAVNAAGPLTDAGAGSSWVLALNERGPGGEAIVLTLPTPLPADLEMALEALRSQVVLSLQRASLAEELLEHAADDERARIARELHDFVGRGLGAVLLQARGALGHRDRPAGAFAALEVIEARAAEALDEMDVLLRMLRQGEDSTNYASLGLRHLERLIRQSEADGLSVELRCTGDLSSLPAAVDLAAFRILQEALTNVVKHSPGVGVTLDVERTADAVSLRVRNEMCRPPYGASTRVGRGIVGMRERAALLRGDLQVGPTADGGWAVVARLPLRVLAP